MCAMFCPSCSDELTLLKGGIAIVHRHPTYGPRLEVSFGPYVICQGCSLVSQVDATSGQLIDLGSITLADVVVPFVPGIDDPHIFIQSGSTRLHRRDS
jgi:hypothetical protein